MITNPNWVDEAENIQTNLIYIEMHEISDRSALHEMGVAIRIVGEQMVGMATAMQALAMKARDGFVKEFIEALEQGNQYLMEWQLLETADHAEPEKPLVPLPYQRMVSYIGHRQPQIRCRDPTNSNPH